MAKRKRDPREEKVLDYLNKTANDYGENDKSSRKLFGYGRRGLIEPIGGTSRP
jgi:hypothetical protein